MRQRTYLIFFFVKLICVLCHTGLLSPWWALTSFTRHLLSLVDCLHIILQDGRLLSSISWLSKFVQVPCKLWLDKCVVWIVRVVSRWNLDFCYSSSAKTLYYEKSDSLIKIFFLVFFWIEVLFKKKNNDFINIVRSRDYMFSMKSLLSVVPWLRTCMSGTKVFLFRICWTQSDAWLQSFLEVSKTAWTGKELQHHLAWQFCLLFKSKGCGHFRQSFSCMLFSAFTIDTTWWLGYWKPLFLRLDFHWV